jgi:hypothetical protein
MPGRNEVDRKPNRKEQIMSQSPEAVETAVAVQSFLGSQPVTFPFLSSTKSTRTEKQPVNPPQGTKSTLIALQGFNVEYTDEDYELKNLQVSLSISGKTASCTATLRDRNLDSNGNGKKWEGSVVGLVTFFGQA